MNKACDTCKSFMNPFERHVCDACVENDHYASESKKKGSKMSINEVISTLATADKNRGDNMDATGILKCRTMCPDCTHYEVCKLTGVLDDLLNEFSNVLDNYDNVICNFITEVNCEHYIDNTINIRGL